MQFIFVFFSQDWNFDQEMSVIHAVNARINSIMAKHSPVLIVQRCLRGYLLRRKLVCLFVCLSVCLLACLAIYLHSDC